MSNRPARFVYQVKTTFGNELAYYSRPYLTKSAAKGAITTESKRVDRWRAKEDIPKREIITYSCEEFDCE